MAITIAGSCTKEEAVILQPTPQLSQGDGNLLQYEYYDTLMVDVESEIRDALIHLQDDQALGYVSINRGIWMIETGISYLHPDTEIHSDTYLIDSTSYLLTLTNAELAEADLKAIIIERSETIVEIESNSSIAHVATNFFVSSIVGNEILISAHSIFLTEFNIITFDGCTLPASNYDRKAGYPHECGSVNAAGLPSTAAANSARFCLRKYHGPNPYDKNASFYNNVTIHASIGWLAPYTYFNSDNLLGNPNSPFSQHQTPVNAHSCVTKNQQDVYANTIYTDIEVGILTKFRGLIYLKMYNNKTFSGQNEVVNWEYENITTGKIGWITQSPLQLSYL